MCFISCTRAHARHLTSEPTGTVSMTTGVHLLGTSGLTEVPHWGGVRAGSAAPWLQAIPDFFPVCPPGSMAAPVGSGPAASYHSTATTQLMGTNGLPEGPGPLGQSWPPRPLLVGPVRLLCRQAKPEPAMGGGPLCTALGRCPKSERCEQGPGVLVWGTLGLSWSLQTHSKLQASGTPGHPVWWGLCFLPSPGRDCPLHVTEGEAGSQDLCPHPMPTAYRAWRMEKSLYFAHQSFCLLGKRRSAPDWAYSRS